MASCGLNALCANTLGFYKCFCSKGFTGNSPRTAPCNDVDECAKNGCHKDAICKNTVGSFTCRCKKGFKGDGHKSCVDIDECKVPANEVFVMNNRESLGLTFNPFQTGLSVCRPLRFLRPLVKEGGDRELWVRILSLSHVMLLMFTGWFTTTSVTLLRMWTMYIR